MSEYRLYFWKRQGDVPEFVVISDAGVGEMVEDYGKEPTKAFSIEGCPSSLPCDRPLVAQS